MPVSSRKALTRRDADAALVATVTVVTGATVELGEKKSRPWQTLAWDYWAELPELQYPTTQLARLLTRMNWDVEVGGRMLSRGLEEGEEDEAGEFMANITAGIGLRDAVHLLAVNLQVAAQCWYIHRPEHGWNVYSVIDPQLRDLLQEKSDDIIRLEARITDPRDQRYAIGPFSSIIGPAEELLTLGALSRTQSKARIAAGILLRPSEAQFPEEDADGNRLDPFGADLLQAMTAPIRDEHDPSALVPIDVEVPGDTIDKFKHLTLDRPYDDTLHERMDKATKRIAIGLDIPPELLTGVAELNHWSAWLVDEDTYKNHAEPLAERVGEVFAVAAEQMLDLDRGDVVITPDPGELFAKRSTVRDALSAASIGAVGLRYVRDAIGAADEDAPDDEDIALMLAMKGGSGSGMGGGTDGVVGIEPPGDDVAPQPVEGPPPADDAPVAASAAVAVNGEAPVADADLERFGDDLAEIDRTLRSELVGAMNVAVLAARNRVGAKVRTAVRSSLVGEEADAAVEAAGIDGVDNADVVARLGPRAFELIDVEATVADSLERDLAFTWRRSLQAARAELARVTGIDTSGPEWDEAQAASVDLLVASLTEWTVAELVRTTAEMNRIPAGLAREVVAAAGGS